MSTIGIPGLTVHPAEVAEAADVDRATAKCVLETLVEMDRDGTPWQDRAVLERMFDDEGLSNDEIAAELGCSPETVKKWRRRFGIRGENPGLDEAPQDDGETEVDEMMAGYRERV